MGTFYSAVACAEEHGTATERFDGDAWVAGVQLRCAWADRYALIEDLLLNGQEWPHGTQPLKPIAVSASIAGDKSKGVNADQIINYADAVVTVGYSSATDVDLISESLEPTAEFITLDFRKFKWGNGDKLLEGETPGRLHIGLNYIRTRFHVGTPLPTTLLTHTGSTNDANVVSTLLGLTFVTETLLFQPPIINRTITAAGIQTVSLTMKWTYKGPGWNTFWRADTNAYERLKNLDGTDYNSYVLLDHQPLMNL